MRACLIIFWGEVDDYLIMCVYWAKILFFNWLTQSTEELNNKYILSILQPPYPPTHPPPHTKPRPPSWLFYSKLKNKTHCDKSNSAGKSLEEHTFHTSLLNSWHRPAFLNECILQSAPPHECKPHLHAWKILIVPALTVSHTLISATTQINHRAQMMFNQRKQCASISHSFSGRPADHCETELEWYQAQKCQRNDVGDGLARVHDYTVPSWGKRPHTLFGGHLLFWNLTF